ncbi:MAG: hypothetical protein ACK4F9_06370 [Brevinematia bacterium]
MPICPVCDGSSALGLLFCGYCGCTGETNDIDYFYIEKGQQKSSNLRYEDWIFENIENRNLNKKEGCGDE